MAEMVGAELGLETVHGLAFWASHYSGIGANDVKRTAIGQECVGTCPHACKRSQIQFDEFQAATASSCGVAHDPGRAARLVEISRRPDDFRSMRHQCSRRLHAKPGRYAGYQYALA